MPPKKPPTNLGRLSGAGKWITVSVTTVAAIIGILVNARNLGLAPWLNIGTISFADLAARRIMVYPPLDTVQAIGDTLHLAAMVTDEHGATLAGATLIWSTDDSAVAVVDSAGGVVARGPGTATISASVREHNARARVTVWQRVRSVAIAHDSVLRLPEGASVQLVARALDARGHAVQGRGVKWVSADSTIVAVSSTGSAAAAGTGRTLLTASTDGYSANLPAEVALTAANVKLLGGLDQRAAAGARLPQSIQVQVFSRGGRPVPDAIVMFSTDGDGKLSPETATTDRNGHARVNWTLGAHAGRQRLLVNVGGMDSTLAVVAEADPVPRNTRVQLAREAASGPAGARITDSVGVRVTDAAGAAAADVPVTWTAQDGGTMVGLAQRTDSVGEAWAYWTLGPRAGTQHARVQLGNPRTMPSFGITATALAETATAMTLVSGANQEGRVGAVLKLPVVAQLVDRNGNPVAGATIRVVAVAGTVADSAPVANTQGRVLIRWTLGSKAGPQTLELSPAAGTPIRVSARALPLEPANLAAAAVPASAAAGRALVKPITFTVTDAYGNPVPGVQMTFGTTGGSVSPVRVMSDVHGQAITRWTLGSLAGDQTLQGAIRGTTVKTTVVVRATGPRKATPSR